MHQFMNPGDVHQPLGVYSQSVKVSKGAEWLTIAGQVGIDADGALHEGIQAQAEQAFRNVMAILAANGMDKGDLVKLTVFLTDPRHVEAYRVARKNVVGDQTVPASTLLVVQSLASPDWLIEVEAMAARA